MQHEESLATNLFWHVSAGEGAQQGMTLIKHTNTQAWPKNASTLWSLVCFHASTNRNQLIRPPHLQRTCSRPAK